jgi:hypothetical protein
MNAPEPNASPGSPGPRARRRAAKDAGKLTAAEFGARLNASPPLIRELRAAHKIAADQDGMIDASEEDRIRAKCPCHEPGCPRVGLGPSGYCEDHKANGQRGAKRTSEQRERIAAGMRGKPRPANAEAMRRLWADPDYREKLEQAQAKARQEAENVKREKRERDGFTVDDVVRHLRNAHVYRSATSVAQHIRDGLLEAERIPARGYAGRGVYIVLRTAAAEYPQQLLKHPDGRMTRFNFESAKARCDWYEEHWPHKAHEEQGRLVRELNPDKRLGPERKVTREQIAEVWRRRTTGPMVKRSVREIAGDMGLPKGRVERVLAAISSGEIAVP